MTRSQSTTGARSHERKGDPHRSGITQRLNRLRRASWEHDGIVSTAGLLVGVAAATPDRGPIRAAVPAGLAAGAVSMALGEYVSVSSQHDSERALLDKERRELEETPQAELQALVAI